jgi:hypothetical protein
MNPPAMVRVTVIYTKADKVTGLIPEPVASVIPGGITADMMQFVGAQRQNYALGVSQHTKIRRELVPNAVVATYTNMAGQFETIELEIYPDRLDTPKKEEKEVDKYLFVAYGDNGVAAIPMSALPSPNGAEATDFEAAYQGTIAGSWANSIPQVNQFMRAAQINVNGAQVWTHVPISFEDGFCQRQRTYWLYALDVLEARITASIDTEFIFYSVPTLNGEGPYVYTTNGGFELIDGEFVKQTAGAAFVQGDQEDGTSSSGTRGGWPYAVTSDGTYYHGPDYNTYIANWDSHNPLFTEDSAQFVARYEDSNQLPVESETSLSAATRNQMDSEILNTSTVNSVSQIGFNASADGAVTYTESDQIQVNYNFGGSDNISKPTMTVTVQVPVFQQVDGRDIIQFEASPFSGYALYLQGFNGLDLYAEGASFLGATYNPALNFGYWSWHVPLWPPLTSASRSGNANVIDDIVYFPNGESIVAGGGSTYAPFAGFSATINGWLSLSNGERWIRGWVVNHYRTFTTTIENLIPDVYPLLPQYRRVYCNDVDITTQLENAVGVPITEIHTMLIDLSLEFIQGLR